MILESCSSPLSRSPVEPCATPLATLEIFICASVQACDPRFGIRHGAALCQCVRLLRSLAMVRWKLIQARDSPESPGTKIRLIHANMHQRRLAAAFVERSFGDVSVQTAQRRQEPSCSFHVTCREHWQEEKAASRAWICFI
jgi:hypothetical protein